MKIRDLLRETPEDIKLLLSVYGYDLEFLVDRSFKIKEQFISNQTNIFKIGMMTYLSKINQLLYDMANVPQWEVWI